MSEQQNHTSHLKTQLAFSNISQQLPYRGGGSIKKSCIIMNTTSKTWPEWPSIDLGYVDQIRSHIAALILLGIFSYSFITIVLDSLFFRVNVPYVGYRSFLEPTWLVRLRFVLGGRAMIQTGYERVSQTSHRKYQAPDC